MTILALSETDSRLLARLVEALEQAAESNQRNAELHAQSNIMYARTLELHERADQRMEAERTQQRFGAAVAALPELTGKSFEALLAEAETALEAHFARTYPEAWSQATTWAGSAPARYAAVVAAAQALRDRVVVEPPARLYIDGSLVADLPQDEAGLFTDLLRAVEGVGEG